MAINRTIDLLPEYFRTIPNQRFLNSTLDRLVSDPQLRQFDGYVGRRIVNGTILSGSYITEPTAFRTRYQLEPEYVFRAPGQPTRAAGFKDVLNSVAARGGITTQWNRLLTNNSYSYTGFVDLDKFTNYYNYVWIPEPRVINGTRVDENPWFRFPVEVSNSSVPATETFTIRRSARGFTVDEVAGVNPELSINRGGTYRFQIEPSVADGVRKPLVVGQLDATNLVSNSLDQSQFNSTYGVFNKATTVVETQTAGVNQTEFVLDNITYTPGTYTLNVSVAGIPQATSSYVETNKNTVTLKHAPATGASVQFQVHSLPTAGLTVAEVDDFNFKYLPFCVEAWVRIDNTSCLTDQVIVGQWQQSDESNSSWALMRTSDPCTLKFVWRDADTGAIQNMTYLTPTPITTGQWHHVAITRTGPNLKMYISDAGAQQSNLAKTATIGTIARSDKPLIVGNDLSQIQGFRGGIDDLRITKGYARYVNLYYDTPGSDIGNDAKTVFLLNFDGTTGSVNFLDNVGQVPSFVWLQTHPGTDGVVPTNPNITARYIRGAQNNGITAGDIVYSVPAFNNEQEQFYRQLNVTGNSLFDFVDLATVLNFDQVDGKLLSVFNQVPFSDQDSELNGHRGGIDGITDLDGKTMIFVNNQQTGWNQTVPWEQQGWQSAGWEQTTPIPSNLWFDIWQIAVINGVIKLSHLQTVGNNYKIRIKNGVTYRNTNWFKSAVTNVFESVPTLSGNYTTLFLQDDQNPANVIPVNVINTEVPTLNVDTDIVGKRYYTSGNGVRFIDGLRIRFGTNVEPASYVTPQLKAKSQIYQGTYVIQSNTVASYTAVLDTVTGITAGMTVSGTNITQFTTVESVDATTNTVTFTVQQTLVAGDSLQVQIGLTQTDFTFTDVTNMQAGDIIHLDDEQLLILSVDYENNQAVVTRGYADTAIVAHATGSRVKIYTAPTYIVEGVGDAICLVPYQELTTAESYLSLAQDPDYITINRASADRNPWSRTNRWFNKAVVDTSIQYLQDQGINVSYPQLRRAARPILEFQSGLRLYDYGTKNLTAVDVLDTTVRDALSNINGRRVTDTKNITLMQDLSTTPATPGHLLVEGDLAIFNADLDPEVRQRVYQIQYVDVDGDLELFTTYEHVIVASTGDIEDIATTTEIDGYTLNPDDRVLIWQQNDATENGIYQFVSGQLELVDPVDHTYYADFYVFVAGPVGDIGGNSYRNTYFRYFASPSGAYESGITAVTFEITTDSGPVINLVETATAQADNCTTVTSRDSRNRGINYYWNASSAVWQQSTQTKEHTQQSPLFDVFDYDGFSYGDSSIYPSSTFAGSTLFEYQENPASAPDPILGLRLTYRNITNVGDITFSNTYGTDSFAYVIDTITQATDTIAIADGVVKRIQPLTLETANTTGWSQVLTNLELYQNLQYVGVRTVDIKATLLNKTAANSTQVWVDGQQVHPADFTLQTLADVIRLTIADTVTVNSDSTVLIKLIAANAIADAWYDAPTAYAFNPYNQTPASFTHDDIKQHTDAIHSQHGHAVTSEDTENSLNDPAHAGRPGLILLQEGFSVLPTLMLTDPRYDIDRALKTAADDYELFKQKFLQTTEQVENIVNLSPRQAVDAVFAMLNANNTSATNWYSSDMVPVAGTATTYVVDDPQQKFYEIAQQIDAVASNRSALVYLNGQQLTRGVDYQLFTGRAAIEMLRTLSLDDQLAIYQLANTDGCCVPATPAKLGLAPAYVPSIYSDDTYQTATLVIQGHDGSITRAYNDYRDALILEMELRIFNNIKVDSEFWSQVIADRVPEAGRFRELNGLATYNMTEQAAIERKFFYEWVAENRVNFRTSVYQDGNTFTYNYSGSTDRLTGDFLLGYWRGAYRDFFDSDRPHANPWEMLGLTVKPSWWDTTYGPAPYSGENLILWQDIQQGLIRDTGEYSVLGPRTTNIDNISRTAKLSVLDIIPVGASGQLYSPNESVAANLNTTVARNGFTFNDGGPAETAWRRSSTYRFARLRAQILENPQFMLGTLWDLDRYRPQVRNNNWQIASKFDTFKLNRTQNPSIGDVLLHNLDSDTTGAVVRRHSILNYVSEYLNRQGETADLFRYYIQNSTVNLVYNLAGFADKDNLTLYAEQNSPQTIQQSVKIPSEDYTLLLTQSMPVGQVIYSGVIVTQSENGYRVSGYDREYPFFIINPSKTTGKSSTVTVGSQSYVIYEEFEDQPIYVPYNFEFSTRQTVVDFLNCYGEYLRRQGFVFDTDRENERINWTDAAIQFIKWSYYSWSSNNGVNRISVVLNPSSSLLKFSPVAGTLDSLLRDQSLLLDENQDRIDVRYLDVFRDADVTYINNQQQLSVISAMRANLVNYEHKIVINNQTVFNDLIYNPVLGTRQNRIRAVGLKTADWNGTLLSNGFLMMLSDVEDWQPNTDYLRGSIVKYKNQNWVALSNIIGDVNFQTNSFSIMDTNFQDQLMPSIGAKALDLEHSYDPYYHNSIPDMVRLRCDALGYVERTWLANLGLDLLNQTEFYRGWIKQKGTLDAVGKFTSAGTTDLLADFTVAEEYAVKLGEYGSTGRTGFVEVALTGATASNNPIAVEFVPANSTVSGSLIQVSNADLYKKSLAWDRNFIQNLDTGNLVDEEMPLLNAGPVLPAEIYDYARANTLEYSPALENQLTFNSKLAMTQTVDTGNLLKNIQNGNWIWVAVNDTNIGDDRYDVMSWGNSQARVLKIVKNSQNSTIDFYLSAGINTQVDDIVAVDHTDATARVQGVFVVSGYQVVPTADYYSILSVTVSDLNQYTFSQNTYDAAVALQSIYTYTSMRHSDIGSAQLTVKTNRLGLPVVTKAYVDNDVTGYAVYDFRKPYATGISNIPDASGGAGISKSVAQDPDQPLIWVGCPDADGGQGAVVVNSYTGSGSQITANNITTVSPSIWGTLQMGTEVVSLTNGYAAATATDAGNQGLLYILEYADGSAGVFQTLGGDFNGDYYGASISASADGQWLAVGATRPAGAGTVYVYYNAHSSWVLTHAIDDPDATVGGLFGASVSLNADGSVLAVGAPNTGNGCAYIFNRNIQRVIKATAGTNITLYSPVGVGDRVNLRINGTLQTAGVNYTAPSAGDTALTTASTVAAGKLVEVDLLTYTLVHTQQSQSTDIQYGASVAANGNFVAVGSPYSTQTLGNQTLQQRGRLELLALESEVSQSVTVDTTSGFSPDGANSLRVNNWIATGTNTNDLVTAINDITLYTGVTATLDGTDLILEFQAAKHLDGIVNVSTGALNLTAATTGYRVVAEVANPVKASSGFAQKLRWITSKLLTVVENYTDFDRDTALTFVENNTKFDSGSTVFYNGEQNLGQRVVIMQMLRTGRDYLEALSDTVQLVRSQVIANEQATGVTIYLDGNLDRLWVGNAQAVTDTDNLQCYTNEDLVAGWTVNRQEQTPLDAHSIFRAWIYNTTSQEKLVDLDVVDIQQGLLPGAVAQYIDYVSSTDPAAYGVPQWRSGVTYAAGFRVVYNDTVYVAQEQNNAIFFNPDFWAVDPAQTQVANTGSQRWGSAQVGETWFQVAKLRSLDYQQGSLADRTANYNDWFPASTVRIYEWVASSQPPAGYTGTGAVDANTAYVHDSSRNIYYFWVLNKTAVGDRHPVSAADVSNSLRYLKQSGLPMISPATSNGVIVYNVKNLVDSGDNVLHIDYVLSDHNNRLHSEYLLLSEDGTNKWLDTPLYAKMVDSLSGIDVNALAVPDTSLAPEDRYGVSFRPRQSMFRDRTAALDIYFATINDQLINYPIAQMRNLDLLKLRDLAEDHNDVVYSFTVPDRDTLLILDVTEYAENTQVLVISDQLVANAGWNLVKLIAGSWVSQKTQQYDLASFWSLVDWQSSGYIAGEVNYVIPHMGYWESITPAAGDYVKIINNGDSNYAIYEYQTDGTLMPVYIQNGTMEFNSTVTGDGIQDPQRMIITALNEHILTADLGAVANRAFFSVLRFVLQESRNVDWLFRTSFINISHRVKNLNRKTNYRKDDEQFIKDFMTDTKPFHTRIRDYVNVYTGTDTAGTAVSDFDLPALYDQVWYQSQFVGSTGKLRKGQARYFDQNIALTEKDRKLYVGSDGLADHAMGLFGAEQVNVTPAAQDWVFAINTTPTETATKYPVPVNGAIGIATNGVPFYSVVAADQDTLTSLNDPNVSETYTVNIGANSTNYLGPDAGNGFIVNDDAYVYRMNPSLLYTVNSSQHSPLLGYALDGNPIYGPYGYRRSDGSGGIILNTSSYRLRNDLRLGRISIDNGTAYAIYVPPTGEYIEDWEYMPGLGTLDEHNGRFVITPEYPFGTYAYFATINPATGTPAYPYIVGPTFYGVPTGLRYDYVGENTVAVYDNGHYQMPAAQSLTSTVWPLHSPTGLAYGDQDRLTQGVYANWTDNHTYELAEVVVSDPGSNYEQAPNVDILAADGVTKLGTVRVSVNTSTKQLNPTATIVPLTGTKIAGLTQTPIIEVTSGFGYLSWDSGTTYAIDDIVVYDVDGLYYQAMAVSTNQAPTVGGVLNETYWQELTVHAAILTPVLVNSTVRKIGTTMRFDRVRGAVTVWDINNQYAENETVYYESNFYRSLQAVPVSTSISSTAYWQQLTAEEIAQTEAANRITALYSPTANMISNDLTQLLAGADYAGVKVTGTAFTDAYQIPQGRLIDQEDVYQKQVVLNLEASKLTENIYSYKHQVAGSRSGDFAPAGNYVNIQYGEGNSSVTYQDPNLTAISPQARYFSTSDALLAQNSDDFTIEFWFMTKQANSQQVMFDGTSGVNFSDGIIVQITSDNTINVTGLSYGSGLGLVNITGGLVTENVWQHVAVERKANIIKLYLDGYLIDSQTNANWDSYSSPVLTLGARVDASTNANIYMDELRITNGLLRYDLTTPGEEYVIPVGGFGRTAATDPYIADVVLLYGFESLSDDLERGVTFVPHGLVTTIEDHSVNRKIVLAVNEDYIDTTTEWTNGADNIGEIAVATFSSEMGVNGYSIVGIYPDFNLGTDDFTMEFWARPDSTLADKTVFTLAGDFNNSMFSLDLLVTTLFDSHIYTLSVKTATATVKTLTYTLTGTGWTDPHFISIERQRQTLGLFVNGQLVASDANAFYNFGNEGSAVDLTLSSPTAGRGYLGDLADFRITRGVARHAPVNTVDTVIASDFADYYLGIRSADIMVAGSGFVNNINSPATEEHINGRLYDTLDMRVFSDETLGTATGFRMFKDMLENWSFSAIPGYNVTTLAEPLLSTSDEIVLMDASGFTINDPTQGRGVLFVGGERIVYRNVDLVRNRLTGLIRGTLGTHVPRIHDQDSRVENAGIDQALPGTPDIVAVAHTVQDAVLSNVDVIVDSVKGIRAGMTVAGENITGAPLVVSLDSTTNTVTLDSPQNLNPQDVLTFDTITVAVTQPFTWITANSLEAYANTWNNLGVGDPADGNGLQLSTTPIALFLLNNPTLLP